MANAICKQYRDKIEDKIVALIKAENPYQPLSDRSICDILESQKLYCNSYIVKLIRQDHKLPTSIHRKKRTKR